MTSKVEYWTGDGKKSVYLTVNFMLVRGTVGGREVEIERPVEFFVPAGQRDEGQQWISSNMRLLSMVARSGGSIAKALANMREVVWDKGPVRHGSVAKAEGGQVPRIHDSEVAAIGHALQEILIRRGFLDAMGAQMPTGALACTNDAGNPASPAPVHVAAVPAPRSGKQCPECGAHALRKVDGCLRCEHCHHIGSCG